MIVSHRHRFIFFAVPRTASHSIRHALRPHLAEDDWEQQRLTAQDALPVPALAVIGHGHISVRQAEAHLPASIWRDYYKFAVVREPVTRFFSACSFLQRGNPKFHEQPQPIFEELIKRPRFRQRVLIQPQYDLLRDERGRLPLDRIARHERLQRDFSLICADLGLEARGLAVQNASPVTASGVEALGEHVERWLKDFYRQDFATFGYPEPQGASRACG